MYGRSVASSEQADARVPQQLLVERGAPLIARDLVQHQRGGFVREVEQRQARAVGDHDFMVFFDAILLRENQLAQSVLAPYPVAKLADRASRPRLRFRRDL